MRCSLDDLWGNDREQFARVPLIPIFKRNTGADASRFDDEISPLKKYPPNPWLLYSCTTKDLGGMAVRPEGSCPIPVDFQSSKYTFVLFPAIVSTQRPHFSLLLIPVALCSSYLVVSGDSRCCRCRCCCYRSVPPRLATISHYPRLERATPIVLVLRFVSLRFVSFRFFPAFTRSEANDGGDASPDWCVRMYIMVPGLKSLNRQSDRCVRILRDMQDFRLRSSDCILDIAGGKKSMSDR